MKRHSIAIVGAGIAGAAVAYALTRRGFRGITCAPVVGELTAQWVAEGGSSHPCASALNPARLLG